MIKADNVPQLAQYDKDRMDHTFEASEYLAQQLVKYAQIELYYQRIPFDGAERNTADLENAMLQVYVAVLQYSAEVKKSLEASVACKCKLRPFFTQTGLLNLSLQAV